MVRDRLVLHHALARAQDLPHLGAMGAEVTNQTIDPNLDHDHGQDLQLEEAEAIRVVRHRGMDRQHPEAQR